MDNRAMHDALAPVMIELAGCPMFVVDPSDKVTLMNGRAKQLVASRRGLGVRRGMLVADWTDETMRLGRALRTLRKDNQEVMLAIGRQACRWPLTLRLATVGAGEPWCLILADDPTARPAVEAAALRAWYGLTRRESEIAAMLAAGRNVDEASRALDISRGTAATHLKHVYSKLGVNSQAQLVTLLAGLPQPINAAHATTVDAPA